LLVCEGINLKIYLTVCFSFGYFLDVFEVKNSALVSLILDLCKVLFVIYFVKISISGSCLCAYGCDLTWTRHFYESGAFIIMKSGFTITNTAGFELASEIYQIQSWINLRF